MVKVCPIILTRAYFAKELVLAAGIAEKQVDETSSVFLTLQGLYRLVLTLHLIQMVATLITMGGFGIFDPEIVWV